MIKTQKMAPTNRSKSKKPELTKSQRYSKTDDSSLKTIEAELKNMKKAAIVSPPRINITSNNDALENKCTLSSFGIKAARCKQYSQTRQTKLKCCVIETPEENSIVFRFEPDETQNSSWCEKILNDDIKDKKEWVVDLNFDDFCYSWVDNFVPQQNSKGYPFRLFTININSDPPPLKTLLKIGQHICDKINEKPGNKTKACVNEKDFIWINYPTWSQIIGVAEAQKRLKNVIGTLHENTYLQHTDTIHAYFRENDLPDYLARLIGAPQKQPVFDIDEDYANQNENSDDEIDEQISLNK